MRPGFVHDERGQAAIFVAVLLTVLLGFAGFVIDFGHASQRHRHAQNAADAAAQGAAYQIYAGSSIAGATSAANTLVQQHLYVPATNLTVLQYVDGSGVQTTDPNSVSTVHAEVTESVPTMLMGILGIRTMTVSAAATALVTPPTIPCVLCILDLTAPKALEEQGNNNPLTVTGGAAVINSNASNAADLTGDSSGGLSATAIQMVGGYKGGPFSPTPVQITKPIPDPLSNIPVPTCPIGNPLNQASVSFGGNGTLQLQPGTYDNITNTGNGTINFQPGLYCITGTIQASNGGNTTGTNATIYLTCGLYPIPIACISGQSGGKFNLSSNGIFGISGPTRGTYQGLSVFADRNNVAKQIISADTSLLNFSGTIYIKSGTLELPSNASQEQLKSMVVVDKLIVTSNGGITLAYDKTLNYRVRQLPVFTQ